MPSGHLEEALLQLSKDALWRLAPAGPRKWKEDWLSDGINGWYMMGR